MDNLEYVTLKVGGREYAGWTRITVQYGAAQAVRAFAATITDESDLGKAWNFMPDTEVEVIANGDRLLKGFIDRMVPSFDATNHTIEISGRSKGADAVDSSHTHDKSEFRNKTVLEIAQALDKDTKVGFTSSVKNLPKVEVFRLLPGETVFHAVQRLVKREKLFMMAKPDGSIEITEAGKDNKHPKLVEGKNILGASATFDNSNRSSEYRVRGQRTYGHAPKTSLRFEGKAKDNGTTRRRTKTIVHEGDGTPEDAKKRAEQQRDRAYGNSLQLSVRVQGWHDDNGKLWEPNTLVYIESPKLKVARDLLLTEISLQQDASGSFANLTFKLPEALGGKSKPKKASGNPAPMPQPRPSDAPQGGTPDTPSTQYWNADFE